VVKVQLTSACEEMVLVVQSRRG